MREAHLDAARQRGHARAVRRQVGQEVGHHGGGRHGGLEHADEGVAVDGLDHLRLLIRRRAHGERRLLGRAVGLREKGDV